MFKTRLRQALDLGLCDLAAECMLAAYLCPLDPDNHPEVPWSLFEEDQDLDEEEEGEDDSTQDPCRPQ